MYVWWSSSNPKFHISSVLKDHSLQHFMDYLEDIPLYGFLHCCQRQFNVLYVCVCVHACVHACVCVCVCVCGCVCVCVCVCVEGGWYQYYIHFIMYKINTPILTQRNQKLKTIHDR